MKIKEIIETGANISILLVTVIIGLFLIQSFFLTPANNQVKAAQIKNGTKINIPDVDWKQNNRTLILYVKKGCRFCNESMPFYQKLAQMKNEKNTRFIVVSQDEEKVSRDYLMEHKVDFSDFRQDSLSSIGVFGTPTLILVNEKGEVSNSWVGKLSPEKEQEVINQL